MIKFLLYSLPLLLLFCGCEEKPMIQRTHYFSMTHFLNSEIKQHQLAKTALLKQVSRDITKEERKLIAPRWEHELKPFFECDIDKPAWYLAYDCDSVQTDSMLQIVYVAIDQKAPVRRFQVDLIKESVQLIDVIFEKTNTWFSMKRHLVYKPESGYQISGEQHMALSDPSFFEINVTFITP